LDKKLVIIAGSVTDYLEFINEEGLTVDETIYTEVLGELMTLSRYHYILGTNWGNYPHVKGSPFCCSFKSRNYRVNSVQEWRDKNESSTPRKPLEQL